MQQYVIFNALKVYCIPKEEEEEEEEESDGILFFFYFPVLKLCKSFMKI